LRLDFSTEGGIAGFFNDETNFGSGRVDLRSSENTGDARWAEGYSESEFKVTLEDVISGRVEVAVSGVGAITRGDGDAAGFTSGEDEDIDLEELYLRWTNQPVEGQGKPEWIFDISGGRQEVSLGTEFLIGDGNFDSGEDAAYWLSPRKAFSNSGVAILKNDDLALTGFYIKGDHDQDHSELVGLDAGVTSDFGDFGAMYANIIDSDERTIPRAGMDIIHLRAIDIAVPSYDALKFSAEYVQQFGAGSGNEYDAYAYYIGATLTTKLPWTPTITYRYHRFSGADVTDSKIRNFDPLFVDSPDANWQGMWVLGEITGNYLLFNSNERAHMVKLAVNPTDTEVTAGVVYYHFDLDKKNYFGTPVTSRNFADEVDVYAELVKGNWWAGLVAGLAIPNSAAEQAFGDDETSKILVLYLGFSY
jgi:hypothetical protein